MTVMKSAPAAQAATGADDAELVAMLEEPDTRYTVEPENVMSYAGFMHAIGSLKNRPASIDDLFFGGP